MKKDEIIPRDYCNLLDRVAAIFTQARLKAQIRQTLSAESEPRSLLADTFAARERDQRMMHHERF